MTGVGPDQAARLSEDELLAYFETLSNWGRWGAEDELGTLNLLTEEVRRDAAHLIRTGRTVSLARTISAKRSRGSAQAGAVHFMTASGSEAAAERKSVSADWFGMPVHGFEFTHLDALSHVFWNGRMYNGHDAAKVRTDRGATMETVELACEHIAGRGVLLDVPAARGIERLEKSGRVTPEDLDAAVAHGRVSINPGDIVFVRTGRDKFDGGDEQVRLDAGLDAACLPWIRKHDIAVLSADGTNDARPSGYALVDSPIHAVTITAMGMWLIDSSYLEELADVCAELRRWEFFVCAVPLRLKNATGSPVNPLAIF